jgi:hydrogenase nickel incorporation protein HypA/HybF
MSIIQSLVALATEHARGRKVHRITVEVGALTAVLPDSLHFCFDVVASGTVLEGATLEIVEVAAAARCRSCGEEVPVRGYYGVCGCGSRDLTLLRGNELHLRSMELEAA